MGVAGQSQMEPVLHDPVKLIRRVDEGQAKCVRVATLNCRRRPEPGAFVARDEQRAARRLCRPRFSAKVDQAKALKTLSHGRHVGHPFVVIAENEIDAQRRGKGANG